MQGADQHLIGWTEWAYSGQGDITTSANPPSSESLVYNPAAADRRQREYRQPGHARRALPAVGLRHPEFLLVRQRRRSSSATPPKSLTAWAASRPARRPPSRSRSVEFPDGYQVSVTGGDVRSAPNAAELVIASNGASTVTVTVSAAGT